MFVEFVSSPAGPLLNTGFHFNVGNWPGQVNTGGIKTNACDWLLSSDILRDSNVSEGIFLSIAHWYPPDTTCNYHIQGRPGEIVRLFFPRRVSDHGYSGINVCEWTHVKTNSLLFSFRISDIEAPVKRIDTDCAESLTIYDSWRPDSARIIKTFCNTFSRPMEKVDFVSTGRSLYVRFHSKTGSYSGSSLYYWAHYDFFNNTKFGEPITNTLCDEVFYAWKHTTHGYIRSPLNTLIFKQNADEDLRCQYKFITDRRLFARVLIEITSVSFKELPYSGSICTRCQEERVDKLIIWEEKEKTQEPLACFCDDIPRAVRIISSGEEMNLEMILQAQPSLNAYFKSGNPLFQGNYEFAHGPLCGPIVMGPIQEGELNYPHRNAINYHSVGGKRQAKREICIWELKVAAQRDLWMHLDKAQFADQSCDSARIEVYLADRLEPRFIICPENASMARDLPILSAAELGALESDNEPLPVLIQYTGDSSVGRNSFRILWTELFHLPRNTDGSLSRSYLRSSDCLFQCPDDPNICISEHLVCNGVIDCPHIYIDTMLVELQRNVSNNFHMLDILDVATVNYLSDESPELCKHFHRSDAQYTLLLLFAAAVTLLGAISIAIGCRVCGWCCQRR